MSRSVVVDKTKVKKPRAKKAPPMTVEEALLLHSNRLRNELSSFPFIRLASEAPEIFSRCLGKKIAIDTETTGLRWYKDRLLGVGIYCPDADVSVYFPTMTDEDIATLRRCVNNLPEDTVMILQNAKFDLLFLHVDLWHKNWTILDVTEAAHLVDSRNRKNLAYLEKKYLDTATKKSFVADEAAGEKSKKNMHLWPLEKISKYCVNDCVVTYQLAEELMPQVDQFNLWELFQKDMRYLGFLMGVERKGIYVEREFCLDAQAKLRISLGHLEEDLYDAIGYEFNWRSPQQLSNAIYAGMGIPKPKNPFADADGVDRSRFADAGKYKSTCTSTFILTEKIHHPLGNLISDLRECWRLIGTITKWMELRDDNGYVHPSFNPTGTRTGRLSCSKPNAQNVPSQVRGRFTQSVYTGDTHRTDEYNLRRGYIADPGCAFLSIDYKQMEGRFFGIISKDPFMYKTLAEGKDLHLHVALKVWGDCGEEWNKIHREWSKTIVFGLIYGMTLGSLMYKLNMTKGEAAHICDQYWAEFPRIKPWMDEVIEECRQSGFVRYWSGRIWREDDYKDMFKAANALIQGGCADLLSIAALRTQEWIDANYPNEVYVVSLIHDELMLQVPIPLVLPVARAVADIMQCPDVLGMPFTTDCKVGLTYGSQNKIPKDVIDDPSITELPHDFWQYDPYEFMHELIQEQEDRKTFEQMAIEIGIEIDQNQEVTVAEEA